MTPAQCAENVGAEVKYQPFSGRPEFGLIKRMSDSGNLVYVIYGDERGSKATPPDKIQLCRWIKNAAIKHNDGRMWWLPRPARHADIIRSMKDGKLMPRVPGIIGDRCIDGISEFTQGFLTGNGKFVDRRRALVIARKAGQLRTGLVLSNNLTSEQLW